MCTGIDISEISRFVNAPDNLLKKLFCESEMEYINFKKRAAQTIAGMFSAKEAFFKALGTGIRYFGFRDLIIKKDDLGKPYFDYSENLKKYLDEKGIKSADVSISHDGAAAVSCVNLTIDGKMHSFEKCVKKADTDEEGIISLKLAKNLLPKRKPDSHKGDYGKAFIVAGSKGLTGAGFFSSEACLKCGSGLITLGCPDSLDTVFEILLKEVMTLPLSDKNGILTKECINAIIDKCEKSDVLLIGCGLSNNPDTQKIVCDVVKNVKIPKVIDADGINALSANIDILNEHEGEVVLTPHFMEFSRISGFSLDKIKENPEKCALLFAKKYNVTLVLKSHNTVVVSPDGKCFKNVLGNPGMATGGSGDVLAGAIVSFIGQKLGAFDASCLGVFVHSLAGDIAALDKGFCALTPSDILDNIPYAIKYMGG